MESAEAQEQSGTPGRRWIVPPRLRRWQQSGCSEPGKKTFPISANSVSTLVFNKSTCRAWIDWFGCWGGSGLGLDDIVAFTEGPFWALFGGRNQKYLRRV